MLTSKIIWMFSFRKQEDMAPIKELSPKEMYFKELDRLNKIDMESWNYLIKTKEYIKYGMINTTDSITFKTSWEIISRTSDWHFGRISSSLDRECKIEYIDFMRSKIEEKKKEENRLKEIQKQKEEDEKYTKELQKLKKLKPLDTEMQEKIDNHKEIVKLTDEIEERLSKINKLK